MTTKPTARPQSGDKPVFWTVSISRLSDLFRDITLEYDERAHIEPIHLGFEEAVRHIRERLEHERCDAVIAAGSNAAYLKSRLAIPVVAAKASGSDVMQALARARKISPHVGMISYQQPSSELADFQAAFGLQIAQRSYSTEEDARAQVNELRSDGIQVIVGAGLVTDLAEEVGLTGVFVYSAASIRQAFDDALEIARLTQQEVGERRSGSGSGSPTVKHGLNDLRGEGSAIEAVRQAIVLYAKSAATVLIQGETGTGKEMAAQAMHRESLRARQPFIAVNCGALAESLLESELFGYEEGAFTGSRRGGRAGMFEAAQRGTLFLDEIGEMPLQLQTRLLRVLEEREVVRVGGTRTIPVDVRIISATHCDLEQRMREGRFRADLFYRISVLRLALPPLRQRQEDVPALAGWLLRNAMARLGTRPQPNLQAEIAACAPLLQQYAWPGNVRELRNMMERAALLLHAEPLRALTPDFLQQQAPELVATSALPASTPVPAIGAGHEGMDAVLARYNGNREAAARHLGISRTTLWRRLREQACAPTPTIAKTSTPRPRKSR